jgi:hypothetical protein
MNHLEGKQAMKDVDYLLDVYRRTKFMLQMHLGDISDAELCARPVDSANHIAYQVGHLISSTTNAINVVTPGAMPPLPEDFASRHSGACAKNNSGFDTKQQLLDRFNATIDSAIAWAQKLSEADKAKPLPEKMHGFARNAGELMIMLPVHIAMHVGQMQVIRRKLGKPVLF